MIKKFPKILFVCLLFLASAIATAQNMDQIKNLNVDSMSDEQISNYWNKAQSEGFNLQQLEVMAKAKGVSTFQFSKLKSRIQQLSLTKKDEGTYADTEKTTEELTTAIFGLTGDEDKKDVKKNLLFGYDFFNNPNISFTPSINVATPKNYQLGPGDEILIDIWGAAENTYQKKVNKQGAIRIENIGLIKVSGLTLEKATSKINSYLKRIYAGIGAAKTSYNKVHTDITLSKVRTVQVNIIGEVKVPGTYSLNALSTVLNALYAAGGPTKNGTFRSVTLIRDGVQKADFDIYQYLIKGTEKGNLKLQDQDVILVNPYQELVTVTGEVKRPGVYELKKHETLADLLGYFSGFTPAAYTHRLLVERVNGKQKEVKEIKLATASSFSLQGGDQIVVQKIIDKYENRTSISGAVYRPGNYELTADMTLYDLIEKADGLRKEAFLERGLLLRTHDDTKKEAIAFSLRAVLKKNNNITLQKEDAVQIFHKDSLQEKKFITINGAVNKPQDFDFVEKLQIEDVIAMASGLQEGADVHTIHVSRRLKDGSFETLSENFSVSSNANLKIKTTPFYLKPFDIVSVRYLKGYAIQKKVTIKGEVNFPGNYVITNKDERVSDLILRAGGLNKFAYVKGASLIRRKNLEQEQQKEALKEIIAKDSLAGKEEIVLKTSFPIGIDLEAIMKVAGESADIDMILEEGDVLMIPPAQQTVEVQGEVMSPSLVRFEKGNSLKRYIRSSGGFSEEAKKSKVYVIYSNGDIKTVQSYWFFKIYPKLAPGAVIFVPSKEEVNNRMSTQEIMGITTSLATLGVLIQSLTK